MFFDVPVDTQYPASLNKRPPQTSKNIAIINFTENVWTTEHPKLQVISAASHNGGGTCVGCTIIASWFDQYSKSNDADFRSGISAVCEILPDILHTLCKDAVF